MDILWTIIIGGVAGWLAGMIMTGRGFGLVGNIVVGIVGAIVGKFLLPVIGLDLSYFWNALLGTIVLLVLAGLFKQSSNTV